MRIAVTGASGFVGRAVVKALLEKGHRVVALGRDPRSMKFPPIVSRRFFDPNRAAPQPAAFEGVDGVIHLAGESVAGRWNGEKKRAIYASRAFGTQNVVASIRACSKPPAALVSASAVGFYGARGDEPLFEWSAAGDDFLARVCVGWEHAANVAREGGIRTVCLRTGVVLGNGGALASMSRPFRFGFGGALGSGKQFVPWIHVDDLAAMYVFALANDIRGSFNAVAPDYATSSRFAQAIGGALSRPALLPAPAFALRAIFGEFANTLLGSQLVIPSRAQDAGFTWNFPLLEGAMAHALQSDHIPPHGVSLYETSQIIPAKCEDVFAFFSDPQNLEELTPSTLRFNVTEAPHDVERGSLITYRLKVHGAKVRWKTLIARWVPPYGFIDVQLHGPYSLWRHEHIFRSVPEGTQLLDRVQYALPFAPFGNIAMPLVRRDIESIFAFRKRAIAERFPA